MCTVNNDTLFLFGTIIPVPVTVKPFFLCLEVGVIKRKPTVYFHLLTLIYFKEIAYISSIYIKYENSVYFTTVIFVCHESTVLVPYLKFSQLGLIRKRKFKRNYFLILHDVLFDTQESLFICLIWFSSNLIMKTPTSKLRFDAVTTVTVIDQHLHVHKLV